MSIMLFKYFEALNQWTFQNKILYLCLKTWLILHCLDCFMVHHLDWIMLRSLNESCMYIYLYIKKSSPQPPLHDPAIITTLNALQQFQQRSKNANVTCTPAGIKEKNVSNHLTPTHPCVNHRLSKGKIVGQARHVSRENAWKAWVAVSLVGGWHSIISSCCSVSVDTPVRSRVMGCDRCRMQGYRQQGYILRDPAWAEVFYWAVIFVYQQQDDGALKQ